jgi:hypothetical protein
MKAGKIRRFLQIMRSILEMGGNLVADRRNKNGTIRIQEFFLPDGRKLNSGWGDWNDDGTTDIGIVMGSHTRYLDINNNGIWDGTLTDMIMEFTELGDILKTGG